MKAAFGFIGLLLALAIVALLAKKQLAMTTQPLPLPPVAAPAATGTNNPAGTAPTVRQQSRQIIDQYKQATESALQLPPAQEADKP